MQRLGRMPRASAYSSIFLPLSYIYSFHLFNAGYLKGNHPGQLPRQPRHVRESRRVRKSRRVRESWPSNRFY